VLDAMDRYYRQSNANIHRATHLLSEEATKAYEGARETARRFVNARSTREIVFVRGTTEAINLVASGFTWKHVKEGDEILVSGLEHHSNLVPWQILCERTGATLRVIPIDDAGDLILEEAERLLSPRTKLVAVSHVSNALGTINPVKEIVRLAHAQGVPVLVDGAQAAPHLAIDVQDLEADFYAFSVTRCAAPRESASCTAGGLARSCRRIRAAAT
jgi:cysteine desulfurase/selenocysteine lyase